MIMPMKRIYVMSLRKEADRILDVLAGLGAVHLEHEQTPQGGDLNDLNDQNQALTKALLILEEFQTKKGCARTSTLEIPQAVVNEILELKERISEVNENISVIQNNIALWSPWGSFDPEDIRVLMSKGIFIRLCQGTGKDLKKVPEGVAVQTITQNGRQILFAVISASLVELPFTVLDFPSMGLSQMKRQLGEARQKLDTMTSKLREFCQYEQALLKALNSKKEELKFKEALSGMGRVESIVYLKGFCPEERCPELESVAQKEKWIVLTEEPATEDKVPTYLKNPKWVELVNPVFNFMSIIPGYREADVSFCFLFFFSIFFGMLIGDAGYGLVFFLLTFWLHRKAKSTVSDQTAFYLIYVLSSCAMIWGALTGTFFGVSLFGKFVKPLVPWLGTEKNVQLLCFTIGAAHLTIAHIWRGLRKLPTLLVLSDVGWVAIVWCSFFYAQQFILSVPVPAFINPMGLVAFIIIILFSQPFQDILKDITGFSIGILLTVLTVISTLIDVISYIRLFAVGTAGLALAEAFNQMALSAGFHNLLMGLMSILILVAGHLLNIILGVMAIMVHGLRLNILEFSGHLSLEWSGVKYHPFKRLTKESF